MVTLYPEIKSYVTHSINVEPPHVLHVEESGIPNGLPLVFVHGGPGAGCESYHRRFFDPEKYRIVLFDQRGCGQSTPHASLESNTTPKLIEDMERIRTKLGIDKWVVFGGSWGSTLALVYAQTYPERVLGLILRGIFLCRPRDIQWFYQEGANRVYPDYWEQFLRPIPPEERDNMLAAYYRRLTGDDEIARMSAAKAWSIWEGRCATIAPRKAVVDHFGSAHTALSLARIECHYFMNNCFMEANQIVLNASRLTNIPGVIIQGRYDMICPVEQAWDLQHAWPQSELRIISDAGHSATESGIVDALVKATVEMSVKLEK